MFRMEVLSLSYQACDHFSSMAYLKNCCGRLSTSYDHTPVTFLESLHYVDFRSIHLVQQRSVCFLPTYLASFFFVLIFRCKKLIFVSPLFYALASHLFLPFRVSNFCCRRTVCMLTMRFVQEVIIRKRYLKGRKYWKESTYWRLGLFMAFERKEAATCCGRPVRGVQAAFPFILT